MGNRNKKKARAFLGFHLDLLLFMGFCFFVFMDFFRLTPKTAQGEGRGAAAVACSPSSLQACVPHPQKALCSARPHPRAEPPRWRHHTFLQQQQQQHILSPHASQADHAPPGAWWRSLPRTRSAAGGAPSGRAGAWNDWPKPSRTRGRRRRSSPPPRQELAGEQPHPGYAGHSSS